jgi:signal transduction histidine kinase
MRGTRPVQDSARAAVRIASQALPGLIQVLAGPDRAPTWRSERQRRAVYAALRIATLVLCIVSLASLHDRSHFLLSPLLHQLLASGLAVAVVAPLLLAARYPLLGWRIGWVGLFYAPLVPAHWWGGWPWGPAQVLVLLVLLYAAAARNPRGVLWWMWGLSIVPWWLWVSADLVNLNGPVSATVVFTATTIALDSIFFRRRVQQDLAEQTERTELERARLAVLQERARIARELHDVVAHHMSLIAVRAETAPYRLSDVPEPVRAEFQTLSATAREAMADMRRLLGVLWHDQPPERAPQPVLSDLPLLIDAARQAGVRVELTVPGALDQVPARVGVCAYRIVQESLSNASQHAPGAAVTVLVGQDASAVLLRVTNGPGASDGQAGDGHGLVGMRERVALLGGSLSAGPVPGGGFVVSAVLPVSMVA